MHHSSFDVSQRAVRRCATTTAGTVAGFLRQVHDIAPGIDALVERAISDRTPMVVEGVHLLPDIPSAHLCERATTVRVLLAVRDEAAHREHFHTRGDADAARARSATWRRSTGSASCRTI